MKHVNYLKTLEVLVIYELIIHVYCLLNKIVISFKRNISFKKIFWALFMRISRDFLLPGSLPESGSYSVSGSPEIKRTRVDPDPYTDFVDIFPHPKDFFFTIFILIIQTWFNGQEGRRLSTASPTQLQ